MIILSIGAIFKSEKSKKLFMIVVSFISMLSVIGIMFYELVSSFFPEKIGHEDDCIVDDEDEVNFLLKEFTEWFDFNPKSSFYQNTSFYFGIIVVLTVYSALKFRQECNRKKQLLPIETPKTIFSDDKIDVTYFIKFFIDYGNQIFGVELTLLAFLLLMFSRLDITSLFYAPFFITLTFLKRRQLSVFWIITTGFVAFSVFFQSLIIGFFVVFKKCHAFVSRVEMTISPDSSILKNLHKDPWILAYDFALLIIVGCQVSHFKNHTNILFLFKTIQF